MLTKLRILSVFLCAASLSACMIDDAQNNTSNYQSYNYQNTPLYPEGYDNTMVYMDQTATPSHDVVVPESYHVGAYQSPRPPKDLDRAWVNNQPSQNYTIEIADGENAAHVAGSLQKAPKSEHMAEVKYQRGGKAYYKGLYGTYPSAEAAQQALSALPEDIKQNAGVKTWGSIQQGVSE